MKTLLTYQKLTAALFAVIFVFTLHGVSDAQTYSHIYVDAVNGVNAPTGRGSAASPYQSITFALLISERDDLPDPWHVHIHPGNYNGDAAKGNAREIFPLKLRREMIFEGTTTAEECIIDGQHTGDATVPILHGEDTEGVTIRNLTVQNSLRTNGVGGIVLDDPTGTKETPSKLEGCTIHNNRGGGVWSNMPLILTGNTFSNNSGNGVWNSKSTAAMNNTFRTNSEGGLHIQGNSTGDISENVFQDNQYGLYAHTLEGTVTGNTFTENEDRGGFWVRAFIGDVTHNTFTRNVGSRRGSGGGFHAGGFTGNVAYNTFENNLTGGRTAGGGFLIGGNDRNNSNFSGGTTNFVGDVIHNVFTENTGSGGGFFIRGNFTGNVAHNTFTGNTSTDSGGRGGGFNVVGTFTGTIDHNDFTRNTTAEYRSNTVGGGFVISKLVGNITHNIFDSNSSASAGAFELLESTNTVEVFNNVFFNNTSTGTGNSVVTRHATHFMNNLFMISDELSEGVSGAHTVWLNSPECRFHNNIFTGVKTAIYTDGTFDLHITHNLFHNVKIDFVEQAGNNLGNELLFWELVAGNATDNLEGDPQLVDPVTTRDFHLQSASPAIDAGTNAFAPADDFDGVIRPVGATVDIGPYEYGGTPIVGIDDPIEERATDPVLSIVYPAWDVNEDGKTDITDLVAVAAALGTSSPANPRLDVNGDGTVNIQDLILVATHLGETTVAAAPIIFALPKHFTPETLQQLLDLLRTQNDGSLAFQHAIANVERLLVSLTPKETALLANYPNPFNPETWIPYQLAARADVTLRIYAVDGTLVRTLSLGHKTIGTYQSRNRAAYWDGKNEVGEPVASGIYFYTLTADDFTATRKMIIRK